MVRLVDNGVYLAGVRRDWLWDMPVQAAARLDYDHMLVGSKSSCSGASSRLR